MSSMEFPVTLKVKDSDSKCVGIRGTFQTRSSENCQ